MGLHERWVQNHQGAAAQRYAEIFSTSLPGVFWQRCERPVVESLVRKYVGHGAAGSRRHLDLATGTFRLRGVASSVGLSFVGIDTSLDMMKAGGCSETCVVGDCTYLPFADHSMALVTAFRFFLNLPDEGRLTALDEVARVMAGDAVFIVNFQAMSLSLVGLRRRLATRLSFPADRTISVVEVERLLHQHFEVVEVRRLGVLPVSSRIRSPRLSRVICRLDNALSRLPLVQLFGGLGIFVATRKT